MTIPLLRGLALGSLPVRHLGNPVLIVVVSTSSSFDVATVVFLGTEYTACLPQLPVVRQA